MSNGLKIFNDQKRATRLVETDFDYPFMMIDRADSYSEAGVKLTFQNVKLPYYRMGWGTGAVRADNGGASYDFRAYYSFINNSWPSSITSSFLFKNHFPTIPMSSQEAMNMVKDDIANSWKGWNVYITNVTQVGEAIGDAGSFGPDPMGNRKIIKSWSTNSNNTKLWDFAIIPLSLPDSSSGVRPPNPIIIGSAAQDSEIILVPNPGMWYDNPPASLSGELIQRRRGGKQYIDFDIEAWPTFGSDILTTTFGWSNNGSVGSDGIYPSRHIPRPSINGSEIEVYYRLFANADRNEYGVSGGMGAALV